MICAPGFTTLAVAQQAPPGAALETGDPRADARMRLGIFYLTPTLSIERVGLDSNVFTSGGEPKSDFTATMTPATTVWVPVARRALLTAHLGVGLVYYKTFSNQRSVNPGVSARGELYARRLTFTVDAGTSSAHTQPNFEIDARVKHVNSNLGGGVRFQMQRLSVEVSTYRQTTRFGDDAAFLGVSLRDTLDRAEQGMRLAVRERLTSLTTVGVIAETRQDRFERSPDRNADGYRVAATIDLAAKALISGSAEVGFRHLKPDNPMVPAFDGLVAKVAVGNNLGDSFQTRFGWDRDTHYSFDTSLPYYVSNAFSATLRRQVAGRFDAILGASRSRATYRALAGAALVDGRREITMTYTVDVGYRVSRESRLGLAVSRINRTSSLADARQYGATRAGLSFNYGF